MWEDAHGFPIHQKPTGLHRLDKFFTLQYPHSLEQPEGFLGCHNPNRECLVLVLPIT